MDAGAVRQLPVGGRHFAVDDRGVGLRATWHLDHGFVNLSLWDRDRCVQTFHLTPVEAGRLVAFLVNGMAEAVPGPERGSPLAAVPASLAAAGHAPDPTRRHHLRRELAARLDRAAAHLRP
jgi:hypothetical protein